MAGPEGRIGRPRQRTDTRRRTGPGTDRAGHGECAASSSAGSASFGAVRTSHEAEGTTRAGRHGARRDAVRATTARICGSGTSLGSIGIISAEPQFTAHIQIADNLHYVNWSGTGPPPDRCGRASEAFGDPWFAPDRCDGPHLSLGLWLESGSPPDCDRPARARAGSSRRSARRAFGCSCIGCHAAATRTLHRPTVHRCGVAAAPCGRRVRVARRRSRGRYACWWRGIIPSPGVLRPPIAPSRLFHI
ncbi:hypothetical protein SAMN04490240_2686 [Rhodococcus pyridinivorans]|nr:hypothetical protein SAMN04490240_2686 [Rhodococcus pyridinivorans]